MRIRADAVREGTELVNDIGVVYSVEDAYVRVPGREDDPKQTISLVFKRPGFERELHYYEPGELLTLAPSTAAYWAAVITEGESS